MKYLKTYENKNKYKVGDYVKIKIIPDYIEDIDRNDENNLFVKIIKIVDFLNKDMLKDIPMVLELSNGKILYGNQYFIRRKMKKKEIKEYELRKTAKQYNL